MPISEGTAALIGAGVAAAGATATTAGAFTSAKRAYKYNKKLAQWQNEVNLQNWNLQNQYNSPSAQLQRLRDAGLNPLYYGLDGNSTDAFEAAAASPYVSPSLLNPFEGMQNLGSTLADIKVKQAQADNLAADTAKKNNENVTETQRRSNMQADIDKIKAEIDEISSRSDLNKSQRDLIDKTRSWIDRKEQANLDYTNSLTKMNDSQRNRIDQLLEGEKVLQSKSIDEFEYRWNQMLAAAEKDKALAGLTQKDIENYGLTHMDSGFLGTGLSAKNAGIVWKDVISNIKDAIKDGKKK